MPSKITPLITNQIYHLYNRGVDKRVIFNEKKDFLRFYNCLHLFNTIEPTTNYRLATGPKNDTEKLVSISAYSLLPNHFHLVAEQKVEGGISEFMKRVSTGYASYFNEKYDRSGSLFQGKFKRKLVVNDEYYNYLFAYVNENHWVHNVQVSAEICYSSSVHYQKKAQSKLISKAVSEFTYNHKEAVDLAQEIYKNRLLAKAELFE